MSKRFLLSACSALTVMGGGLLLSTPASADPYFACSESQKTYVRGEISDVCGSQGGSAIVTCDGSSIQFHSISCGSNAT
jgi:hypothetical protein